MASRIQAAGYQYKLKCNAALDETKTALCKFVAFVFKIYHQQLLSKCDKKHHLLNKHNKNCKYKFKSKGPLMIETNCIVYENMYHELSLLHVKSDKNLRWSSFRFEKSVHVSNSWEIAKLFISSTRDNSRGPNDIDALTMFRIINSCKLFEPIDHSLLDKLMTLVTKMHKSSCCDKETMTTTLKCMVDLLQFDNWGNGGDTSLKSRTECQKAAREIIKLLDADVSISLSADLTTHEKTRKRKRAVTDDQLDEKPADARFEKRSMAAASNKEWYTFSLKQDPATSKPAIRYESKPETNGGIRADVNECIDNTVLNMYCKKYGRKSSLVTEMCEKIGKQLMSCSTTIKSVEASYKPENEDEIIFVLYTVGESESEFQFPTPLKSFPVQCRVLQRHSMENKYVMESKLMTKTCFLDDDRDKIKYTLREHSKSLMEKHKNLNIISACPIKSRKYSVGLSFQDFENCQGSMEPKVCVVFFVNTKGLIPIEEDALPSELNGFLTDIREGSVELYSPNNANALHEHLKMGCKISAEPIASIADTIDYMSGTLGAFVDDPNHGICCITSAHAVLKQDHMNDLIKHKRIDQNDEERLKIYQPDPLTSRLHFGHVLKAVFRKGGFGETGFEAVLIKITDLARYPLTGNFPKCDYEHTGYTVGEPMTFMSGDIYHPVDTKLKDATLLKYGFQTGLTRGGFVLQGASIRKSTFNEFENKFGFCLHDQIMVVPTGPLPFADHGDSGALVLAKMDDSEYLQAIGIVSGGASDKTTVFVTPILPILEALDLNQQLKLFQSPMEEDTVANNTTNHARLLNERLEHIEQRVDGIEKNISGQRKEMNDFKKELSDKQDKHTQILLSAIASSKTNS